jgi:hypothetical protein
LDGIQVSKDGSFADAKGFGDFNGRQSSLA